MKWIWGCRQPPASATAPPPPTQTPAPQLEQGRLHHFELVVILNGISALQAGQAFSFLNPLMPNMALRKGLLVNGLLCEPGWGASSLFLGPFLLKPKPHPWQQPSIQPPSPSANPLVGSSLLRGFNASCPFISKCVCKGVRPPTLEENGSPPCISPYFTTFHHKRQWMFCLEVIFVALTNHDLQIRSQQLPDRIGRFAPIGFRASTLLSPKRGTPKKMQNTS